MLDYACANTSVWPKRTTPPPRWRIRRAVCLFHLMPHITLWRIALSFLNVNQTWTRGVILCMVYSTLLPNSPFFLDWSSLKSLFKAWTLEQFKNPIRGTIIRQYMSMHFGQWDVSLDPIYQKVLTEVHRS